MNILTTLRRLTPPDFKIGDRVRYAEDFCRSVSADADIAALRGEVAGFEGAAMGRGVQICLVRWDGFTRPSKILNVNLERVRA